MNRKGRLGCGCLLIALGAPVAFVAYLYVGLAGIYGTDDWWQEPVIWVFLLAGLVAAVTGIVLMFGTPKRDIDRLADLHARGMLTDEEFQAAKARLLGL